MSETIGGQTPGRSLLNEAGGGPWGGGSGGANGGSGGSGSGGGKGGGEGGKGGGGDGGLGPRNPWDQPPRKRPSGGGGGNGGKGPNGPTALDELLRRGRQGLNNGLPTPQGRKTWAWLAAGFVALWVVMTSFHQVGAQQRGVVTRFGKYVTTMSPGVGLTLPAPIDRVTKVSVDEIREINIDASDTSGAAAGGAQNLMVTGDQNIIDLAYSVRWNIRDPELYLFELADPDDTIREVAESAMRAEIARVSLNDAIGAQRSQIEGRVQQRIQTILDSYRAGVLIQGVAIKQADPPAAVVAAFKDVSAAQQEVQSYLNNARAYALQLTAKAQGEAAAFDKVYDQYRLAPEVTRKRMYYETMEDVLAKTDKTVVETPGVTSYLPLNQLPRAAAPPATPAAPAAPAVQEGAAQ
ncbi:FtsH protease activity modulator HflK [Sphingomonas montana]|uniref:FtsH protease activity modulator HflK n=1 Tax=Sphingomonas montana TaxID=1843236 RepID=UPI00096BE57D|nr:FtsH protease activity modulator HflK [Sphingomonas montana]